MKNSATGSGKLLSGTHATLLAGSVLLLAGCEDGAGPGLDFLKPKPAAETPKTIDAAAASTGQRDVEAPDVFSANEDGLWDGRPSLGGVWVAYPGVKDPERVIIRNEANGKSVIGALFRRERDNPGPKLQVSSDAAGELEMLAGQPVTLSVIALRKEDIPAPIVVEPVDTAETPLDTSFDANLGAGDNLPEPAPIEASSLDPVAAASAAIDRSEVPGAVEPDALAAETAAADAAPLPVPVPVPVAATPEVNKPRFGDNLFAVTKPFIQVGTFTDKTSADEAAATLRSGGVLPVIKEQAGQNTTFYRVLVGPATNRTERRALNNTVKDLGFGDAYFVPS